MRLITTLFTFVLCTAIGFSQNYAKQISNQSNSWLEENDMTSETIHFNANVLSDAVELFWEVSTEQAVSGYELQRSTNGENFKKIAWFASVGEGSIGGTYLHLDESPFSNDIIEYRIKAIRKDGRYGYSFTQIVDIQLSRPAIDLSAANIQPSFIALDEEGLDTSAPIELLDASGKTVLQLSPDSENLRIDLSEFQEGVYFLKMVLADGEDKVERIVKQG